MGYCAQMVCDKQCKGVEVKGMNLKDRIVKGLLDVGKKHKILVYPTLALVAVITAISHAVYWGRGNGKKLVASILVMVLLITQSLFLTSSANEDGDYDPTTDPSVVAVFDSEDEAASLDNPYNDPQVDYVIETPEDTPAQDTPADNTDTTPSNDDTNTTPDTDLNTDTNTDTNIDNNTDTANLDPAQAGTDGNPVPGQETTGEDFVVETNEVADPDPTWAGTITVNYYMVADGATTLAYTVDVDGTDADSDGTYEASHTTLTAADMLSNAATAAGFTAAYFRVDGGKLYSDSGLTTEVATNTATNISGTAANHVVNYYFSVSRAKYSIQITDGLAGADGNTVDESLTWSDEVEVPVTETSTLTPVVDYTVKTLDVYTGSASFNRYGYTYAGINSGSTSYVAGNTVSVQADAASTYTINFTSEWTPADVVITYVPVPEAYQTLLGVTATGETTETYTYNANGTLLSYDDVKACSNNAAYYLSGWKLSESKSFTPGQELLINTANGLATNEADGSVAGVTLEGVWEYKALQLYVDGTEQADPTAATVSGTYGTPMSVTVSAKYKTDATLSDEVTFALDPTSVTALNDYGLTAVGGSKANSLVISGTPTNTTTGLVLTGTATDDKAATGNKVTNCTITLVIGKKTVTIDDDTVYGLGTTVRPSKEYDGSTVISVEPQADVLTPMTGDNVKVTFDSAATLASADAGENIDVTLSNVELTGTVQNTHASVADCYQLDPSIMSGTSHVVAGKGRVSKRQLVATIARADGGTGQAAVLFGQDDPEYVVTLTDDSVDLLADSDKVTYAAGAEAFMTGTLKLNAQSDWTNTRTSVYCPAGTYTITPTFGTSNYNVSVSPASATFTVSREEGDSLYTISPVPDGHTFVPSITITPTSPYTKVRRVTSDVTATDTRSSAEAGADSTLVLNTDTIDGTVSFVLIGDDHEMTTMVTVNQINIDTTVPELVSYSVTPIRSTFHDPLIPFGAYSKQTMAINLIYQTKGSQVTKLHYYFLQEDGSGSNAEMVITGPSSLGDNKYSFNINIGSATSGELIVYAEDQTQRTSVHRKLKLNAADGQQNNSADPDSDYYEWMVEADGSTISPIAVTDGDGTTAVTGKWYNDLTFSETATDDKSGLYSVNWIVNGTTEDAERPVAASAMAATTYGKVTQYKFVKNLSAANADSYPAGSYTVGGVLTDNAGNTADLAAVGPYNFDAIKPVITISDGVDSSEFTSSVEMDFTATEGANESGIAKVALYKDSVEEGNLLKSWNTAEDAYSYNITSNGTYYVVATDNAGNVNQATKTFNKISSLTPETPVVEIEATADTNIGYNGWFINEAPEVTITSTDTLSDGAKVVTHYTITYDDGTHSESDTFTGASKTFTLEKQGHVVVTAYAVSESNVRSGTGQDEADIDTEKPVIEITDSKVDSAGNVTVSFKVNDSTSGVDTTKVTVNGEPVTVSEVDGLVTGSFKANGTIEYVIEAYDNAGNAADAISFTPLGLSASPVMDVTTSSALLEAYVTKGTNPIAKDQCYVQYKPQSSDSWETALSKKTETPEGLTMTQTWANLKSNTVYDYRVVAKTSTGNETRTITGTFKTASKDATATIYGQARYDASVPADYEKYPIYVNLYQGDTCIAGTRVTEDGNNDYIFKNVSNGTYRVVASDGLLTKEAVAVVENGGVTYPANYASQGGVILVLSGYSTAVEIEDGDVEVAVDGLEKVFDDYSFNLLFDDADEQVVRDGGSIKVVLHASYTKVSEVGSTEASIFSTKLGANAEVVRYITLYVTKELYDKYGNLISSTEVPRLAEPVRISFPLEDLAGQTIYVASLHGDENDYSFTNWGTAEDATITNDYVIIMTDRFSLYALYRQIQQKKITVNWINGDSSVMKTETVIEGSAATPPTTTPTKKETDKYTFSFSGWDLDYSKITSDMANSGKDTVNILSRFYATKKSAKEDPTTEKKPTTEAPPTTEGPTTQSQPTTEGPTTEAPPTTEDPNKGGSTLPDQKDSTVKPSDNKTAEQEKIEKSPVNYTYMGSSSSPKTGDMTPVALLIALMGISGTGIVILGKKGRKKN